jgi:mannose-1-phosphate guanylyltransferase / mannose-6-phosphate isomerase
MEVEEIRMQKKNQVELVPVILCGGVGARLWPVSRELHPKPFIELEDGQSLLQKAYLRALSVPGVRHIITVSNRDLVFKIRESFQGLAQSEVVHSLILEPCARNTAAAIASACVHLEEQYGKEVVALVLPADHLIEDQEAFASAVAKAQVMANQGRLVTFGLCPTRPETGYGYLQVSGQTVVRFIEKPDLKQAEQLVQSKANLWNSGMFCFSVGAMLQEMTIHCPNILATVKHCMSQARKLESERDGTMQVEIAAHDFSQVPEQSIDYAVMEHAKDVGVVACDFSWQDMGCWQSLSQLMPKDEAGNRVLGHALMQDSTDCSVHALERMVALVGVQDLIVVDTKDALLVMDQQHAQSVKRVYTQLKKAGSGLVQTHALVHRPWGSYTVLEEGPGFKIKRIEVRVGAKLSLQLHHHRSEHWVIVSGEAKVTNGESESVLEANQSTYIPIETKHRLENIGSDVLILIEVQCGHYLGEDDIVRFDDVYARCVD